MREPYDWEGGAKPRADAEATAGCAGCVVGIVAGMVLLACILAVVFLAR